MLSFKGSSGTSPCSPGRGVSAKRGYRSGLRGVGGGGCSIRLFLLMNAPHLSCKSALVSDQPSGANTGWLGFVWSHFGRITMVLHANLTLKICSYVSLYCSCI